MFRTYTRPLAIFAFFMFVFSAARLLLWRLYPADFAELPPLELLSAFVRGLRFDASVVLLFIGLPLLLMLLPARWARTPVWTALWSWACFAVLLVFVFLLAADLAYFGYVHRHIGPEIVMLGADLDMIAAVALRDFGGWLIAYGLAAAGLFLLWRRLFIRTAPPPEARLRQVPGTVAAVFGMALLVRGGIDGKPIGIVDAFDHGSTASGFLALNSPFTVGHSLLSSKKATASIMPWNEAVTTARALAFAPGERALDPERYPLARARAAQPGSRPNVVVLMLESWDAAYVDALRRERGQPPLGMTPNFDALARQGRLFTRFYANGERSIEGLAAILAGLPTLPGTSYLGFGMEQSRLSYLGRLAQQEGYDTVFLQASKRKSFRIDSIAALAGFRAYYGAEDIPASGHIPATTDRGAWDYDALMEANRRFAAAKRPFLGYVFTASTHPPFDQPGGRWQPFPADNPEHRFLNTLAYSDWALGEFFAAARAAGYFDHTLFVLTADHVTGFSSQSADADSQHHVPLLLVGAGVTPGRDARIGSHIDILPTIAQIAGWSAPQAGLGRTLLDTAGSAPGAFAVHGDLLQRIEPDGWVAHDLRRRVEGRALRPGADLEGTERRLLAQYQVVLSLLQQNRVLPAPANPGAAATVSAR